MESRLAEGRRPRYRASRMAETLSIVALVVSSILLAVMIATLVLLRRGEGPTYGASRAYDANRREAVRILTGDQGERIPGGQWYDPRRKGPSPGAPVVAEYRAAVAEALRAVVPPDRGLAFDREGNARIAAEGARVLPAVSTADLRAELDRGDSDRLAIGLVLFNAEPPGGDASRVALPVQVLFGALSRAGREDLVRRFAEIKERATRSTRIT